MFFFFFPSIFIISVISGEISISCVNPSTNSLYLTPNVHKGKCASTSLSRETTLFESHQFSSIFLGVSHHFSHGFATENMRASP